MKATLWIIGSLWTIINWPTNFVLGDNLFDLFMEMIFVVVFVAICAIPVWLVIVALRGTWNALSPGPPAATITFGEKTTRVLAWLRRSSSYKIAFVVTVILLVPPHLYMSWSLREYKTEFKNRAMHSLYTEVFYGEPGEPGEFDYGGKLDELVIARVQILARHQFVPYFTATWRTNGILTFVPGAYVYTYLPKSVYDSVVCKTYQMASSDERNAKELCAEYIRFLDEPFQLEH